VKKSIDLYFKKRPLMAVTALVALLGRNATFDAGKPFPRITARQDGIALNKNTLAQFNRFCDINNRDILSVVYPFTMIYPLIQRILAQRAAPLSLFVVLNNRMQVTQHRGIGADETLDLFCEIAGHRLREKGLEMDILSTVKIAGVPVWENIQTFYYRGKFGKPDPAYIPPQFAPLPAAADKASWFLPEGAGRSFARVSGDGNPLHYWKAYARLLGFQRDFAQPLMVLGSALGRLLDAQDKSAVMLDIALKAPVYYENNIVLKSALINDSKRFDIYCAEDPLPCISGKFKYFKNENPLAAG
jgi:hypothetical protein